MKCDRVAAGAVVIAILFVFGNPVRIFGNPVSFCAAPKLTGLAKNELDCQKRTVLLYYSTGRNTVTFQKDFLHF